MSTADVAAIAGTFLAAVISGLGLRRGEAERRGLRPAARGGPPTMPCGGLDAETQRSILEALREIHADMVAWRRQDEVERRADRDRITVERFEQIEVDQARMLSLLRKIDGGEDEAQRRR